MSEYKTEIPKTFNAGDSIEFAIRAYDNTGSQVTYADGYTMYVIFNNATNLYSASSVTTVSQGYLMSIASTATSGWSAGDYTANVFVDDGTNRYQVTDSYVQIKPDLFNVASFDSRTTARQILDAINATLLGTATSGQQSLSVGGPIPRAIGRMSLEELITAKNKFERQVQQEDNAKNMIDGKPSRNTIQIRWDSK